MTPSTLLQRARCGTARLRQNLAGLLAELKRDADSGRSRRSFSVVGPTQTKRLGSVMRISTIPSDTCTYACVYCRSASPACRSICRVPFADPYSLFESVKTVVDATAANTRIDYLAFVLNGEPTLDLNLAKGIWTLRDLGYKIAVFTNGSLLWNEKVREDLLFADYVSVKTDTAVETTWHELNRPHSRLNFSLILDGLVSLARHFRGTLTTETLLVRGINDSRGEARALGDYLTTVKPATAYVTLPGSGISAPEPPEVEAFVNCLRERFTNVEALVAPDHAELLCSNTTLSLETLQANNE
jgi:wyosine [tRNA(Phe)-imidazoG37] synthetase (radical SAM superfamily)